MRMSQATKRRTQIRTHSLTNASRFRSTAACVAFCAASVLLLAPMSANALNEEEVRTKAAHFALAAGTLSKDLSTLGAAKTSKTFKTVLGSLDTFSRLSPALGFIGAGIDIAGLFGSPKVDPTLKKLGELDKTLDDLKTYIGARFDRLQDQGDFTALRSALIEDNSVIGASTRSWNVYSASKDPTAFGMWTTPQIQTAAERIASYCDQPGRDNLFVAIEKDSYGDAGDALKWGSAAILRIAQAQRVDAAIQYLDKKANPQRSENTGKSELELLQDAKNLAARHYGPLIKRCTQSLEASVAKLEKGSTIKAWSDEYLRNEVFPNMSEKKWTGNGGAKLIAGKLKEKYPQREWLVIKYDPVSGYDKHYWKGKYYLSYKRESFGHKSKMNVIVHRWTKGGRYSTSVWTNSLSASKALSGEECIHKTGGGPRNACKRAGDIRKNAAIAQYHAQGPRVTTFEWYGRLKPDYDTTDRSTVYAKTRSDSGVSQIVRMRTEKAKRCGKPVSKSGPLKFCLTKIAGQYMLMPEVVK